MKRWIYVAAAAAVLLVVSGMQSRAQDDDKPQAVVIGPTWLFFVRTGDTVNGRELSPRARVDHIHDVLAKHLGGQSGRFTQRKVGNRVHVDLNGDFILAVTPADAAANGYKGADRLAPIWVQKLSQGFEAAHVLPSGKAKR
jgi:hypothetical protein